MEDRIKKVMAIIFQVPENSINEQSSPETIETWDSLAQMQLIVALEEEFGILFDDEQILGMNSFAAIVNQIASKK